MEEDTKCPIGQTFDLKTLYGGNHLENSLGKQRLAQTMR